MHKSDGNSGERERHQADDDVSDHGVGRWLSPPKTRGQLKPWPEASGCCRDVEQHGSAAAKPCWASLLETDEQNTEHAENANTNMGKCDDYTISPEKLLG